MRMQLVSVLGGLLIAALVAAGCGGNDDSGAADSIAKEEFIAKADAICKRSNERMEAAFADAVKGETLKKVNQARSEELVGSVLVPNVSREVEELEKLAIPDGDDERVDAMIAALEEGVETAEDDPEVVATTSSDAIFGIASRIAKEYGLEICGSR